MDILLYTTIVQEIVGFRICGGSVLTVYHGLYVKGPTKSCHGSCEPLATRQIYVFIEAPQCLAAMILSKCSMLGCIRRTKDFIHQGFMKDGTPIELIVHAGKRDHVLRKRADETSISRPT